MQANCVTVCLTAVIVLLQVQASCVQAMRLWWEDYHPGWMIFTLGNQHFETLNQIIQYSQSSVIKGGLAPLQVSTPSRFLHATPNEDTEQIQRPESVKGLGTIY